jgi:hypothetical protein
MNTNSNPLEGKFIHQVYFWLSDPEEPANKTALLDGLQKLSAIPEILFFHIGSPAQTRREVIDSTYSLSWLAVFSNAKDQDIYQKHPIHLDFVASCSHLWNKVVVYDSSDAA